MPGHYAVVIGINYRNFPATMDKEVQSRARLNALDYAEADAEEMAALLEADGYNVVKLVGLAATRAAIINAFRAQSRNAGPEGLLLVHYSGHGALDPDNRELAYLLPADADPNDMAVTAMVLDDIAGYRYLSKTRSALVLLDCCHSGYAVGFRSADKDVILAQAGDFSLQAGQVFERVRGRITIAACAGEQLARENRELKHGVLTYYVLEHWRNSSESINDINLYEYVAQRMHPQQGVPDPVRGGSAQQGIIELRPARTNIDRTPPTQTSEPEASVPRLGPRDRATLFNLISGIVGPQMPLRHLAYLVDLNFRANSRNADLGSMIRSFIKQVEAAKRIPELREAIDQVRADQQGNNPTPSEADDVGSMLGTQGNASDVSTSGSRTASEANIHVQRGYDYYENRLYEQALAEYNRAIELDPKLAVAYRARGYVYYERNDYERALAEYNRAIELDTKLTKAYSNRGYVYYERNDYERALADYNRAIELDPENEAAHTGREMVYAKLGQR
ncbi:MAG TPA: tetratricopeptide repeat protein [Chloroflexia bacterium]|nr:tetratricopeptide repeat protein [Chloroflexia bacterium]